MGKGDQKTRRGKIVRGSYGKLRPRKPKSQAQQSTDNSKGKTKSKAV
jgi:30S ribosomal protein S31